MQVDISSTPQVHHAYFLFKLFYSLGCLDLMHCKQMHVSKTLNFQASKDDVLFWPYNFLGNMHNFTNCFSQCACLVGFLLRGSHLASDSY